jgi:hypothetical protein
MGSSWLGSQSETSTNGLFARAVAQRAGERTRGRLLSIDTVPVVFDVGVRGGSGGRLVRIDSGGSVETIAEMMSEATEGTKVGGQGREREQEQER